ncbi:hypothetical protein CVT24_001117 [Panaeolus cyanescens]|uniref:Uncharacterized protein n=1 Tax=Panaeolus cyanescens TaxID=181874 RepID=A0A409YZ25_9AGAR|nr:hypothetical protein CVT24_001117 [Panaeolus cyanescens]
MRLFLLCLCWLASNHHVVAQNQTIDDSSPAIVYSPSSAWFSNSVNCNSKCLNATRTIPTWHEGISIFNGQDPDDHQPPSSGPASGSTSPTNGSTPSPSSNDFQITPGGTGTSSSSSQQPPPDGAPVQQNPPQADPPSSAPANKSIPPSRGSTTQAAAPAQTSSHDDDNDDDDDDDRTGGNDDDHDKEHHGGSGSSSGSSGGSGKRAFLGRRADADDQVTLSYNFTGSALYLFGVLPPASSKSSSIPTDMNVQISVDGQQPVIFQRSPELGSTEFVSNVSVHTQSWPQDGPHQLVVTVIPNSTFIFDYILVTSKGMASSSDPASTSLGKNPPSSSDDQKMKKHNVATFAGALGGSVGVLGLFSLGLAISIIRRRRLAALRDRRDHESLHTNSSDDSPNMSGPAPFVPRFFPGTVIPAEPPTYNAAVASNREENPVLVALAGNAYASRDRSYADIPPDTPPPPEEEPMMVPPPPPFPFPEPSVAASSVPPSSPRSLAVPESHPAPTLDSEGTSQPEDSVGTELSNSATAPELEPLLQSLPSHNSDRRPESRISSRSVTFLPPLPLSRNGSRARVNVDQEDIS